MENTKKPKKASKAAIAAAEENIVQETKNKGGRPPIEDRSLVRRNGIPVQLFLLPDEYEQLKTRAKRADMKIAAYIRMRCKIGEVSL